jgi:CO/xanthine dehydrogenase Mo-binding subunit
MTAVGISIRRIDGTEKVAGQALYTGDLRLPGMAIAKVLRSPVAHARIRGIDATKARAVPGVLAVFDARQFERRFQCIRRLRA